MYLIDSHAHIYVSEFDKEREALLNKAAEQGVQQILMPAIDATTHQLMLQVENDYPTCKAMMGLHPCSVNAEYKTELQIIKEWLERRTFVAIGEIGLDFYWDKTFTQQQYDCFHQQIEWALAYQLPIVIHSRDAVDEAISVVKQYPALRGVFHCFSGTVSQAEEIMALNFMLGIGGVVTFKNAGLDKVVAQIGVDALILETDAPYLAPMPYRGKRNQPDYLPLVAAKVAAVTGKTIEGVAKITTENTRKLFNL